MIVFASIPAVTTLVTLSQQPTHGLQQMDPAKPNKKDNLLRIHFVQDYVDNQLKISKNQFDLVPLIHRLHGIQPGSTSKQDGAGNFTTGHFHGEHEFRIYDKTR